MYHLEVLLKRIVVGRGKVGTRVSNHKFKFYKYHEESDKDECLNETEVKLLESWLRKFHNNFDSTTIEIYHCDMKNMIVIGRIKNTYYIEPIVLSKDNELAPEYDLEFKVIGYPIKEN